jgi:predicted peptidase
MALLKMLLGTMMAMATPVSATERATGLLSRTANVGNNSYHYQVYIPASLKQTPQPQKVPVIVFLHGIGQRGEGGYVPAQGGAGMMVRSYMERMPAVVVMPQCRKGRYWHDAEMSEMVLATLNQTVEEFGGDPQRLYLIGVSMGGYGAWHMASEYPDKFAAIVPICGGSPLRSGDRFKQIARKVGRTPVWVFHGSADRIVPVSESRQMVEALKATGGNVRYSEYEGVGHNVWLNVASEPDLLPWLLRQSR